MSTHVPNINGTTYDKALNGLIDFINSKNNPMYKAHAVAAIGRFLIENHEIDIGASWVKDTLPLVEDINVNESMVNNIYGGIVKQAQKKWWQFW